MLDTEQLPPASSPRPALPDVAVQSVSCRVFRAPATDGVAMSFAPLTHRVMVVVVVEMADGRRGVGESWVNFPSWGWRERVATVQEGVAPLLVGARFSCPEEAHDRLLEALRPVGRQWGAPGPVHQAVSAVDTALWDLAAREAGMSLAEFVGGALVDELPVYGSSLGPDGVEETARSCGQAGLRAVKVKLGFGTGRDGSNLTVARAVLGPDAEIFGDANQAWTLDEACAMAPVLERHGVRWVEEPLAGDDPQQLALLHQRTGLQLATGENLYGAEAFSPYLEHGGVAILQPDVSKCGGPTDYLRVCEMARASRTVVNPHLYNGAVATAATLQLAASQPATRLVEWDVRANPLRGPLDHLLTAHGTVRVPRGPGLGLDIDLEALTDLEELL